MNKNIYIGFTSNEIRIKMCILGFTNNDVE